MSNSTMDKATTRKTPTRESNGGSVLALRMKLELQNKELRAARDENDKLKHTLATAGRVRKTHCTKGHKLTPENTVWTSRGKNKGKKRDCKKCRRRQAAEQRSRRRAKEASAGEVQRS